MVLPELLPHLLPNQARVYNATLGFVARGMSANAALDALRSIGQGINRSNFLDLYSQLQGETQAGYDIAHTRSDYFPNPDRIPEAITTLRSNYSFTARLDLDTALSDGKTSIYINVATDENMRISDIQSTAMEAFYIEDRYTDVNINNVTVVSAKKRAIEGG
jgi:hypothetical protein